MTLTRHLEGEQGAEKWPEKPELLVESNDLSDEISERLIRREACPPHCRLQLGDAAVGEPVPAKVAP